MRLLLKVFPALLALVFALPALAETRDVPANRSSVIAFYYTYINSTCAYGSKPRFRVSKQPDHGTISAKWQAYKMGKESRNCAGKPMRGMMIIYTPNKGFRGTDVVKFSLSGSGIYPGAGYSLSNGFKFDINVR